MDSTNEYRLKPITKEYIRKFSVLILLALFGFMFNYIHIRDYSYIIIIFALFIYIFGPKTKIPDGAAYYSKILVLDIVGFVSWTGAMMLIFFIFLDAQDSILGAITFFTIFAVLPLYIVWYSIKLSSKWYIFTGDTFIWSDAEGVQSVKLKEIELAEPYVKRKNLFSSAEMGIVITTKLGKKIKIMSNNLEADTLFMRNLQDLYLFGNDTFSQYLKDEKYPEEDEEFNRNLGKLQKNMEEK